MRRGGLTCGGGGRGAEVAALGDHDAVESRVGAVVEFCLAAFAADAGLFLGGKMGGGIGHCGDGCDWSCCGGGGSDELLAGDSARVNDRREDPRVPDSRNRLGVECKHYLSRGMNVNRVPHNSNL